MPSLLSHMNRRHFLLKSSTIALSAVWPLNSIEPPLAQSSRYGVFPTINYFDFAVANCRELELQIKYIQEQMHHARRNQRAVGDEYKRRVRSRLTELKKILSNANAHASAMQTRNYIDATAFGIGILLAGFGLVSSSPILIASAVGAQIILGPATLAVHAVWNTTSNSPWIVTAILQDRSFMVAKAIKGGTRSSAERILPRLLTAAQFALTAWELSKTNTEQEEALRKAQRARDEIRLIQAIIARVKSDNISWGNLYIRNLQFIAASLESYIEDTRPFGCITRAPTIHRD